MEIKKGTLVVADDVVEEIFSEKKIKNIEIPNSIKERTKGKIIFMAHMTFRKEEIMNESELKAEIKRVNKLLRETHNPREYRQNKKHLERLERKLRQCQKIKN